MNTLIEPTTPRTSSSSDPQPSTKNHQPTIAHLPKPTRDMLNIMLDDDLPYHVIVDELAEAGRGITPQSLAQWLQTGYEDYLKNRDQIEEAKTQAEFAADLLKDLGGIDFTTIHRASLTLTAIQIFTAIEQYGNEALRKMLQSKPASYITLLNTLCNMTNTTLKLEDHRIASEMRENSSKTNPSARTSEKTVGTEKL